MIVVTLLAAVCGYVAHEYKVVRERQAWLESHSQPKPITWLSAVEVLIEGDKGKTPSFLRRWLGDRELDDWKVSERALSNQIDEILRVVSRNHGLF